MTSKSGPAIELIDVTKRFGPVVANQDITFDARYGEVHALIGENGAGKSTLMSIVAGLYRPDSGRLRINGQQVHFKSPRDAIERGIGMVYQHFMLVETMTVAENLLIGMPQHRRRPQDRCRRGRRARSLGPVRPRCRPRCLYLAALGRRAAAGRDHSPPLPRREDPRPR